MSKRFTIKEHESADGYEYWFAVLDTATGEEVGDDAGEQEDKSLVRDFSWVPEALNKLDDEITAGKAREKALRETLRLVERRFDLRIDEDDRDSYQATINETLRRRIHSLTHAADGGVIRDTPEPTHAED